MTHEVSVNRSVAAALPVFSGSDAGDTQTLEATLAAAAGNLATVDLAPTPEAPAEVVADKGYHAREVLKRLAAGPWRTRIAEPARRSVLRWHGDTEAPRAVYANRMRLLSGVARVALLLRAVLCERAFAHLLDRGGMRRTWLRGRDNVAKRYLVHVASYNLGRLMRALVGAGTPKAAAEVLLFWLAARRSPAASAALAPRDRLCRRQRHRRGRARHRHARRGHFINGLLRYAGSVSTFPRPAAPNPTPTWSPS